MLKEGHPKVYVMNLAALYHKFLPFNFGHRKCRRAMELKKNCKVFNSIQIHFAIFMKHRASNLDREMNMRMPWLEEGYYREIEKNETVKGENI